MSADDQRRLARLAEVAGAHWLAALAWARAGERDACLAALRRVELDRAAEVARHLSAISAALGGDALELALLERWAVAASEAGAVSAAAAAAGWLERRGRGAEARRLHAAALVKAGQYKQALALLGDQRDPAAGVERARALYFTGRAREALAAGEAALEVVAPRQRVELLELCGHALFALGELEQALARHRAALAEAAELGEPGLTARVQHSLAIVLHRLGQLDEAGALYRAALAQADPVSRVPRTVNLATSLQDAGQLVEARALYQQALSDAVAMANRREQARAGVNLANLLLQLGELPEAIGLAARIAQVAAAGGLEHAAGMAQLIVAEAELEREQPDAAAAALEHARAALGAVEDRQAAAELGLLTAQLALARGAVGEAGERLAALCGAGTDESLAPRLLFWQLVWAWQSGAAAEIVAPLVAAAVERAPSLRDRDLAWQLLALGARLRARGGGEASELRQQAQERLAALLATLPPGWHAGYLGRRRRRELAAELRRTVSDGGGTRLGSTAYRRLLAINRRLAREHEVEPLLEQIVDTAIELLGAERGFLLLAEGGAMRVAVARNFDRQSLEDGRQRISRSIASEALRRGEAILTTNAQEDERFAGAASVAVLKVRSVVCVPLRATTRDSDPVIGALYLDHRFQERAFGDEDVELCESFADQAAIALENARLLAQTREQERRLQEQNARLAQLNAQLEQEAASYAAEAEAALRRLREEGPTVGVGKGFARFVGRSDKLREALRLVDRFADTDVPVVIYGESGTGKELVARAIHERSSRAAGAFVSINCGAMPENLIESELFGYRKGAFTGAVRDKPGLVAAAEGGTLLLDEIGEMPLTMQVKLLRVLQEREYRPVGATVDLKANVRVVSASHANLPALVAEGRFREDLLYRLAVVEIRVPPLRERREDIPLLVDHFCRQITGASASERFSEEAIGRLLGHDWPGNVRELENEVRRALALADGQVGAADLSERLAKVRSGNAALLAETSTGSLKQILDGFERQVLLATLDRLKWNVRQAAKELGLSRAALYTRLSRYGITRAERES